MFPWGGGERIVWICGENSHSEQLKETMSPKKMIYIKDMGAVKYYISTFGDGGGLSQNTDTADALEGGGV